MFVEGRLLLSLDIVFSFCFDILRETNKHLESSSKKRNKQLVHFHKKIIQVAEKKVTKSTQKKKQKRKMIFAKYINC